MSRCYRIRQTVRVSDSLTRDISASDEICTDLEILEILPPEQMSELIRATLEQKGFERDDEGHMVREDEGITVRVDPTNGEVTVQVQRDEHVELKGRKETTVSGNATDRQREELRKKLREELEQQADEQSQSIQRRASEELEAALGELSQELERTVNEVTREALKRKAAQMGEVKEISEDPEAGSLTIKVEV